MSKNIIVFPTDTVYGIGARLYDLNSLKLIYEIKERPMDRLISVLASSISQIKEFAILDERAKKIIDNFLPGPLTLVVKSRKKYFDFYHEETVGVRIPNLKLALDVLDEYGPLKTTSVNKHSEKPINEYEEIVEFLKDSKYYENIKMYENDQEIIKSSLPSTVIDLTGEKIKIIRQGAINLQEIYNVIK